jgi:hypothetical protein
MMKVQGVFIMSLANATHVQYVYREVQLTSSYKSPEVLTSNSKWALYLLITFLDTQ